MLYKDTWLTLGLPTLREKGSIKGVQPGYGWGPKSEKAGKDSWMEKPLSKRKTTGSGFNSLWGKTEIFFQLGKRKGRKEKQGLQGTPGPVWPRTGTSEFSRDAAGILDAVLCPPPQVPRQVDLWEVPMASIWGQWLGRHPSWFQGPACSKGSIRWCCMRLWAQS